MYSPIVIVTLRCSIITLLHIIILKHESVPSTTHLALHHLHPLLLHHILLHMSNELRAVIFDGGSPSPDVSRTVHIPHENINKSWKKQLKFQKLYRDRSQPQRLQHAVRCSYVGVYDVGVEDEDDEELDE